MLKAQLPQILQSIYKCMDVRGEKFSYALLKNKRMVESIVKEMNEKYKPSEKYTEFDKKRSEIAEKHAKKDEKGEPVIKGDEYDIEDMDALEKELEPLKKEYEDVIAERESQIEAFHKEKDEEVEINFHKVTELPDTINAREMEAAMTFMFDEKE